MSVLLDETTRMLVMGASGRQAQRHVPFMREYGTNVVAGVAPGRASPGETAYPIFDSVVQAVDGVGAIDMAVLFVPAAQALAAAAETIANRIGTTVVLAEGVPFRDSMEIVGLAEDAGLRVIGPNCQGVISPGRAKVGASGFPGPPGCSAAAASVWCRAAAAWAPRRAGCSRVTASASPPTCRSAARRSPAPASPTSRDCSRPIPAPTRWCCLGSRERTRRRCSRRRSRRVRSPSRSSRTSRGTSSRALGPAGHSDMPVR